MEPIYLFPNSPSPNATKIVFMDNARAINPVTIDSNGENVAYLQPNSNYTMSGRAPHETISDVTQKLQMKKEERLHIGTPHNLIG